MSDSQNPIFVNDGDIIVVADRFGNTLSLVPLGTSIRVSESQVAQAKARINKVDVADILET